MLHVITDYENSLVDFLLIRNNASYSSPMVIFEV